MIPHYHRDTHRICLNEVHRRKSVCPQRPIFKVTWRQTDDFERLSTLKREKGGRVVSRSIASQRVKTSFRQFSLRTLILAIVAFALVLAFVVLPAQAQFRSRQWVASQRGRVSLTPNYRVEGGWYIASGYCPLPQLIVDAVGMDIFTTVKSVELDCEEIHDLSGMRGFTRMEYLYINQFVHDVRAFDGLRGLPRLKAVTLSKSTGLSTEEIDLISNSLKGVEIVSE